MARIWLFGDNVDTDQIVPGRYAPYMTSEAELGKYPFIEARPEFARAGAARRHHRRGQQLWLRLVARVCAARAECGGHRGHHRAQLCAHLFPQCPQPGAAALRGRSARPGGGWRGGRRWIWTRRTLTSGEPGARCPRRPTGCAQVWAEGGIVAYYQQSWSPARRARRNEPAPHLPDRGRRHRARGDPRGAQRCWRPPACRSTLRPAEAGWDTFQRYGTALPEETLDAVRAADATLFGAVSSPLAARWRAIAAPSWRCAAQFDLYANLRPVLSQPIASVAPGHRHAHRAREQRGPVRRPRARRRPTRPSPSGSSRARGSERIVRLACRAGHAAPRHS